MKIARISYYEWLLCVIVLSLISQSCVAPKNLITLGEQEIALQEQALAMSPHLDSIRAYQPYKIRPYDQLMIRINAFEGSTEEFLNREFSAGADFSRNVNFDPSSLYYNSYHVNDSGEIFLPLLGKIKVTDLSTEEVKTLLDEEYKPIQKYVSTRVRLANPRISVLGEVNKPGVHYLYNERNTLFDAIGMAEDFTHFSNRKKVKLIRRTEEGPKTVFLNLNRTDFFTSEYFYVQPDDMIYVEPLKTKSADVSARSVGIILSSISVAALIVNIFFTK